MTPRARNIEDTPRRQRSLGRGRSGSRGRCNRVKAMQPNLFREEAHIFGDIRISPPRRYQRSTRRVNRVKADTYEPSLANKEENISRNGPLTYSEYKAMKADKAK